MYAFGMLKNQIDMKIRSVNLEILRIPVRETGNVSSFKMHSTSELSGGM